MYKVIKLIVEMRKVFVVFLLGMILLATPTMSRTHIKYIGPRPQQTEAEKDNNGNSEVLLAVVGLVLFWTFIYYANKKK